ncbi:MAG: hypothetical protein IJK73_06935 [Bacteroidales bacterium]|nr:hypothetical protein [Bacteroidales bacterium]
MRKNSIESQAADIVFNRRMLVSVGERTFTLPRPTMATLIAASEVIAELPDRQLDPERILTESMAVAPLCEPVGRIAATLLLGVRKGRSASLLKEALWRLKVRRRGRELLRTLTPDEMKTLIIGILDGAKVGDFFGLTTSLIEVNLLRRTKTEEVEK